MFTIPISKATFLLSFTDVCQKNDKEGYDYTYTYQVENMLPGAGYNWNIIQGNGEIISPNPAGNIQVVWIASVDRKYVTVFYISYTCMIYSRVVYWYCSIYSQRL